MSLKRTPNSLYILWQSPLRTFYLLFQVFQQLHMLLRSNLSIMSQESQWPVVVTLEEIKKGKQEHFETVAPCKWLSRD